MYRRLWSRLNTARRKRDTRCNPRDVPNALFNRGSPSRSNRCSVAGLRTNAHTYLCVSRCYNSQSNAYACVNSYPDSYPRSHAHAHVYRYPDADTHTYAYSYPNPGATLDESDCAQ